MRNRKGLTLIELLAAIVILGILAVFAIPVIAKLLDNSRNKMYISDAKKFISQTEYKLRVNNSNIELPDPSECIVISLSYLDSTIFDNTPNDGEYSKDKSFVVVKNIGNDKFEYSVKLVEKYKGNFHKGVDLVKESTLNSNEAMNYVKSFDSSDLITIDNVTASYINGKIGSNYANNIVSRHK